MKSIRNTTLQGFTVPFKTPKGLQEVFIKPKTTIEVPDSYTSTVLDNLVKRRMFKLSILSEVTTSPVVKSINK
jgi:hypothetical protein